MAAADDVRDNSAFPPSQIAAPGPTDTGRPYPSVGYDELPAAGPLGGAPAPVVVAGEKASELTELAVGRGPSSTTSAAYPPGQNGVFASVILLAKTVLGAGTLSLPFAFRGVGVGLGCALLLVMFALHTMSFLLLNEARGLVDARHHSFGGVAQVALGRAGTVATHIFVCISTFGACLAYFILMGDLVSPPVGYWLGDQPNDYCSGWAKRQVPIYFGLGLEVALCAMPTLHHLRHAATLAVLSMAYLVVIVVIVSSKDIRAAVSDPVIGGAGRVRGFTLGTDVFKSISIMTFAFAAQFNVMPVLNELREPTEPRKRRVCVCTMALCASFYLLVGAFGYMTFFDDTKGNLLLNFEADNTAVTIGRLCVCWAIALGYPLVMRACVASLDALFFPGRGQAGKAYVWRRRPAWLALTIGTTFAIALSVEDVSLVLGLTGASASTCIAFVLPASILLMLDRRAHGGLRRTRWTTAAWLCLIAGTAFGLIATAMAVKDIVDGDDADGCVWYRNATEPERCCPDDRSDGGYTPWPAAR